MRCAKCGTRSSAASRYCRQCGEPLAPTAAPAAHSYQQTLPQGANLERARWFAERGDTDTAIQICRGVVEEHPDSATAHLALAQYLARGGFEDLANTHFEIAAELDPRVRAQPQILASVQPTPVKGAKGAAWREWAVWLRKDLERARQWLEARPKFVVAAVAALVAITAFTVGMTLRARHQVIAEAGPRSSPVSVYVQTAQRCLENGDLKKAERTLDYAARIAPDDPEVARLRAELQRLKGTLVEVTPETRLGGAAYGVDVPRERTPDEPLFLGVTPSAENQAVLNRVYSSGPGGRPAAGAPPASGGAASASRRAPLGGLPNEIPPPLGQPRPGLLPPLSALETIQTMNEPWLWTLGPRRPGVQQAPAPQASAPGGPLVEIPAAGPLSAAPSVFPSPEQEAVLAPSRSIAGSVRRATATEASGITPQSSAGTASSSAPAAAPASQTTSTAPASSAGGAALLEQARKHQTLGLEYQRQGQWEKARGEFRAALQACDEAERAGCERAAVRSVRSSCQAALTNSGS